MTKLNSEIKAIGVENIAQSQLLLSTDKMIEEDKCVVVFDSDSGVNIVNELVDLQKAYKFNAFDAVEDSNITLDSLCRKLNDEDVTKINELLK